MKERHSVNLAIQNLSVVADMAKDHPQATGYFEEKKEFVTVNEGLLKEDVLWFSEENIDVLKQALLDAYLTVYEYFKEIVADETFDFESPKSREGIQGIMQVVGRAKTAFDEYLEEVKNTLPTEKIAEAKIYQQLVSYFKKNLETKFSIPLEGKEDWEEHWTGEQAVSLDLDKSSLKAFDSLKADLEYELFYLKNAEGKPFFQRELLRNIELYCNFGQIELAEVDDPLLKIATFKDKNYQAVADSIIKGLYPLIEEFYNQKKEGKEKKLFFMVNKVVMSLFLAANPKNLLSKTKAKAASRYFTDMLGYLSEFLHSKEYKRMARKEIIFIDLIHAICFQLFINKGGIKEEMIGYIHLLMRKGLEYSNIGHVERGEEVFCILSKGDDQIRSLFSKFPSGPLFKILDTVREGANQFSAIAMENLPKSLFSIRFLDQETSVLKIPSPTEQTIISQANPASEFLGFLRSLKKQQKTLLLCNLQDRTSWKDHARVHLLEELGAEKEFKKNLFVFTLAKDTDFYYQIGSYQHLEKAEDFVALFKEHLLSGQDYGYFFSKQIDSKSFQSFLPKAVDAIWDLFYEKRSALTRKNRLDFIGIFYHILFLKVLEITKPSFVSLTCKDALDVGAVFSAGVYAFIHLLNNKPIDKDFIRYLIYTEALLVRERSVNSQRLSRELSCLAYIQQYLASSSKSKLKVLASLFKTGFISSLDSFDFFH